MRNPLMFFVFVFLSTAVCFWSTAFGQSLEQRLLKENRGQLIQDVLSKGNAKKGAALFFNPKMSCVQCHQQGGFMLAPRLSSPTVKKGSKKEIVDFVVTSILEPSKHIANDFRTGVVQTVDGEVVTGILRQSGDDENEKPFKLVTTDGEPKLRTIEADEVEDWKVSEVSSMPAGIANQLKDRQQFLDLAKYVSKIQEGGPKAELMMFPMSAFFPLPSRKAYEINIDHAGLIKELGKKQFQTGKKIFHQHCASCHGEVGKVGLMPSSMRFDIQKFKNGGDPFSMYQTITDGYGLMTSQHQLVPTQKYAVIHYIREHYVKEHNASEYTGVDSAYLESLPKGTSRGPKREPGQRWLRMDYGNHLVNTYEIGRGGKNITQKGIAVRLDSGDGGIAEGNYWALFEHDTLRLAAIWKHDPKQKHRFIDWNGIHFNDRHAVHPKISGQLILQNQTNPGWGRPSDGSFEDTRLEGRDGKRYGPLAKDWGRFLGIEMNGSTPVIRYEVGNVPVNESYELSSSGDRTWIRRKLQLGDRSQDLTLQIMDLENDDWEKIQSSDSISILVDGQSKNRRRLLKISGVPDGAKVVKEENHLRLKIPEGKPQHLLIDISELNRSDKWKEVAKLSPPASKRNVSKEQTDGLQREIIAGNLKNGFSVDTFQLPEPNRWNDRLRLTGLDFLPNPDQMVVSCWDGTVWRVDGILRQDRKVKWTRIAEGLFQPLGIKVRDGEIFVTCRNQIVKLVDRDSDGITDFYQNFNSDHQVTEHFHEFAMGLQTDKEGNFYYAKSARHAKKALVPHHGTLLKVSKDGSKTEIIANGFRAANGVGIHPDGSFTVTDQEGHWNPKNRINWVKKGGFYGNMWGYHDVTDASDSAMEQPVCWITNKFDRSPGELLWCDSLKWGDLKDHFLNLSYGEGRIYLLLPQKVGDVVQGGMVPLPIDAFPTGVMRGRLHPVTGELYCCGMYAWAGNRQKPGGLYRVKMTSQSVGIPTDLKVYQGEVQLTFSKDLDQSSATKIENFVINAWSLKRSANYGSRHIQNHELKVDHIELLDDKRTVRLKVKDLHPTMGMEIRYRVKAKDGSTLFNLIHNTIHRLEERKGAK